MKETTIKKKNWMKVTGITEVKKKERREREEVIMS